MTRRQQLLPTIHFALPQHNARVKTLGYACGLCSGIVSPLFDGHMPPFATVQADAPITTNNLVQFERLFAEAHARGFQFGQQAADELGAVFDALPEDCWWWVCALFAEELMGVKLEAIPPGMEQDVQHGLKEFRKIYQHHLHLTLYISNLIANSQ